MSKSKYVILFIGAIWLFWGLALSSLIQDSPIFDEAYHLSRGVGYIFGGDPRLSMEHPPLVNVWEALPLLTMTDELSIPFDDPSWTAREPLLSYWYEFGRLFMWFSGNDMSRMLFLARVQVVLLTIVFAALLWRMGAQYWGHSTAGFWAALLFLYDPNIVAHGRYATTDLGGTFFVFLATYILWRFWERPSWGRWLLMALTIGLSFAAKMSALTFSFIWIAMSIIPPQKELTVESPLKRLFYLGTAGLSAILVVWAVYLFEWGQYIFYSREWLNQYSGPLPTFLAGVERIEIITGAGRVSYMLGEIRLLEGFLLYFPFSFIVKTPVVVQLIVYAAVIYLLWGAVTRKRAAWLLMPILFYMGFLALNDLNIGYRHFFLVLPFIYLLAGRLVADFPQWGQAGVGVTAVLVLLFIHPYYLNYFNYAAGGPENGFRLLADSNVDWGEDLRRLTEWRAENPTEKPLYLSWFGTVPPDEYGLVYEPLPGRPYHGSWDDPPIDMSDPPPGIYAISVNNWLETRPLEEEERDVFAWFRAREPDGHIGYSIFIYDVSE